MHNYGGNYVRGDQFVQTGAHSIGKIVGAQEPVQPKAPEIPRTVLMLMSLPIDTQRLRLEEEHRAVDKVIRSALHRDQIKLELGMAPRYSDLQTLYFGHKPAVLHYAGHANGSGIALLDDHGRARPVPPADLERLFSLMNNTVSCVVLNACSTSIQAEAIAKHVKCVVGLSLAVQDHIAIEFATGFYEALANGETVARAFEFGCNRPALGGLNSEGPQLFSASGVAESLRITG